MSQKKNITQNHRIILGLKVRQLRSELGLSLVELSEQAGISVSYLNEIEKGKKYPREEKTSDLAKALRSSVAELQSSELKRNLAPLGELLRSNFLQEIPLYLFGIDLSKVVEIIAEAPIKVGAFISALVETARLFALREENFYLVAMRAYQEMHNNYLEDIENALDNFVSQHSITTHSRVPTADLKAILEKKYQYVISENGLSEHPELQHLRSVFIQKQKKLLLNAQLSDRQKARQYGKEIAFNYLELADRPTTSSVGQATSFEQVLNNFKANYFAFGLLVSREGAIEALKNIFDSQTWQPEKLQKLLTQYDVSPEILFQRFNVLPRFFGLEKLFFFRLVRNPASNTVVMDKELHLNRRHQPHANRLREHYCERWESFILLKKLNTHTSHEPLIGIQRTRYHGTNDEYLCVTIARTEHAPSSLQVSVTVGLLIDEHLKKVIRFWDDAAIPVVEVNVTCERCPIVDCAERAAAPRIIAEKNIQRKAQEALKKLIAE